MLLQKHKRLLKFSNIAAPQFSQPQQCLVCLNIPDDKADRGILPCSHQSFCFQCIIDWAAVTNRCPLCKERFYQVKNSNTGKTVKVVEKEQNLNSDGEFLVEIRCCVCGSDLDDHIMLLCDNCDQGFHTTCLGMHGIPDVSEWYCDLCSWVLTEAQRKRLKAAMKKVGRTDEEEVKENEQKPRKRLRRLNFAEAPRQK